MSKPSGAVTIQWFHITRALGVLVFLYGVFLDDSPERGTIILTGAGLAGFDKVAGSNGAKPPAPKKEDTEVRQEVK